MFVDSPTGTLVPISGTDPRYGEWSHVAYVPNELPKRTPNLGAETFNAVADARAALAALDALARQLPNPALLRRPTLRQEAQSTSALEGTYAPLEEVLGADADAEQPSSAMREVINYVIAAEHAFASLKEGRPITLGLVEELQGLLVRGRPPTQTKPVGYGRPRCSSERTEVRAFPTPGSYRGHPASNSRRRRVTVLRGSPVPVPASIRSWRQLWRTTCSRHCTRSTMATVGSAAS